MDALHPALGQLRDETSNPHRDVQEGRNDGVSLGRHERGVHYVTGRLAFQRQPHLLRNFHRHLELRLAS